MLRDEIDEITHIIKSIAEEGHEAGTEDEAYECLKWYRVIGQMIKDSYVRDFTGSEFVREFEMCRGTLKVKAFHNKMG